MTFDRVLAVVGLILAIAGLYCAWYFYRKTIATKILAHGYTRAIPLLLPVPNVTFSYHDRQVEELSRTFVLLWNRGTAPIERADFTEPIAIHNRDKLLSMVIYDKDPGADVTVNEEKRTISINLLRPSEAVILQLDAKEAAHRVDLRISMKSHEMSRVLQNDRALIPLAISVALWILCVVLLASFDFPRLGGLEMPAVIEAVALVLVFLAMPTLIATMAYPITHKLLASATSPIVWRFFQIKTAGYLASAKWHALTRWLAKIERR